MKKLNKNKLGKGLVSLITIVILLSSILATSIFYQNNITANAIKETSINDDVPIPIKKVDNIEQLSYLNEGFYEIRNGYVYYFDTFNSYVPLYIKVLNQEQQNGF